MMVMSNLTPYKKVEDFFDILGEQTVLTKRYVIENTGEYPIYSGQIVRGAVSAYLNSYKYEKPCIVWTTYGSSAGKMKYVDGKYNIGRNASGLVLKQEYEGKIDLEWFLKTHQHIFLAHVRADHKGQKRLPHQIVKKIPLNIPFCDNGDIDLAKQNEVKGKVNEIERIKNVLINVLDELNQTSIFIEDEGTEFEYPNVNSVFKIEKGNSVLTKKYGHENNGVYPVFSASNRDPLCHIDSYDYDGKYLTWASNGLGGFMKLINGKFSVNGDRGVLIPVVENIDITYTKFVLEPILRSIAKGRKGDRGKNEFTKVSVNMIKKVKFPVPVDKKGDYDLLKQKEIGEKYLKLYNERDTIISEIDELISANIEF